MKYIGVTYDRTDICLPDSLEEEIARVAERIRAKVAKDLTDSCLKLDIPTRRHARIMLNENEDGLFCYISIPEGRK